jgi:rSAM/selenodomain-associated transferase 1
MMRSLLQDVALVVFAKAPVPGTVKTRLVAAAGGGRSGLSAEAAAALHAAFVRDVCERGARVGFGRLRLYAAGELRHPLFTEIAERSGYELRPQEGADLGARMHHAIAAELRGASAVVLIGTDSPTLPAVHLERAGTCLAAGEGDVVLGPAIDGGYYLIGARREVPELFAPGIAWSTERVLTETLRRLHGLVRREPGFSVRLLPPFYDVDTPDDLARLGADLGAIESGRSPPGTAGPVRIDDAPHTRALLAELGLIPRCGR